MANKWEEDWDTWEPTRNYPDAPPARSQSLGKPSQNTPSKSNQPQGEANGSSIANFFQEFAAAAETAGLNEETPDINSGDSRGLAELIANAQDILNIDRAGGAGGAAGGAGAAGGIPELPEAMRQSPEAMRQLPAPPRHPGSTEPHSSLVPAKTSRRVQQTRPEVTRSEGWQSLVEGWDEMPANAPKSRQPAETARTAADYFSEDIGAEADARTAPKSRLPWKSLREPEKEPEAKVKVRRVGTGEPRVSERDTISPVVLLAAGVLLALIGLGIGVGVGMNIVPHPTVTVTATPTDLGDSGAQNPDSAGNADTTGDKAAGGLSGLKVAIDPGHNGGNAAAWQRIGTTVNDGRGGQKPCNTTGTATADGFTEHEFNWKVANVLKNKLETAGASVFLTRDSDVGVGPCVDDRGKFPQKIGADVMISIHANGTTDASARGFFVMISDPAINPSQGEPSAKLAAAVIQAMKSGGHRPQSSGTIKDGLWKRGDLATLNFAEVPSVMVELGEMRNPADATLMKSEAGRQRYAVSLFEGIKAWAEENRPAQTQSPSTSQSPAPTGGQEAFSGGE